MHTALRVTPRKSMQASHSIHARNARTQYTHAMHAHNARTKCTHAIYARNARTQYTHAMHARNAHTQCTHAMHTCNARTHDRQNVQLIAHHIQSYPPMQVTHIPTISRMWN